jgi:hypothetical protein
MTIRNFGAVADISALINRENFEEARNLFWMGELFFPSATYSWLARDKLIEVRGKPLSYSLVGRFVQERELLVAYLPELLEEISRRILFEVDHKISLTDLRAIMLATHLKLPLLVFDEELMERLDRFVRTEVICALEAPAGWHAIKEVLEFYARLSESAGSYLSEHLEEDDAVEGLVKELKSQDLLQIPKSTDREKKRMDSGNLNFRCLALDFTQVLREYRRQHVLQPEVVEGLCRQSVLVIASQGT